MPSTSKPLTTAFSVAVALRGARQAVGLPAIMICFSLVGIGGLVRDIGYPMLAGMLSSALVWAGPAQVLLFGSIATGASLPVVAIAILFSSLRFMPMTISIIPLINDPRRPMWQLVLAAHLIAITNWVEGNRRLPNIPKGERYSYFCGFSLVVMISGTLATGVGYYLVGALSTPLAAVLLFTTPMFFTVNIVAPLKTWIDWLPVGLGVALVPVATWVVGRDYDLVVAGLLGGTLAYGVSRFHRRVAA